jgi:peptide/nickel transport system substrate-binding protein
MVSQDVFGVAFTAVDSWIPPGHWAYLSGIEPTNSYAPGEAETLLDVAGWRDEDGDGVREYHGDGGEYTCQRGSWSIPEGTPLAPVLVVPARDESRAAEAARIVEGLNAVGMDVTIQEQDPATLYSIDGALVQRQFDLALLAGLGRPDPHGISRWAGAAVYRNPISGEVVHTWNLPDFGSGTEFIVERLAADNTPSAANDFTGQNYGGWCDEEANIAIAQADSIRPLEERATAYGAHQLRFAAEVPALPLYVRPLVGAAAERVCGIEAGPYDALTWNIGNWWVDESGACER